MNHYFYTTLIFFYINHLKILIDKYPDKDWDWWEISWNEFEKDPILIKKKRNKLKNISIYGYNISSELLFFAEKMKIEHKIMLILYLTILSKRRTIFLTIFGYD